MTVWSAWRWRDDGIERVALPDTIGRTHTIIRVVDDDVVITDCDGQPLCDIVIPAEIMAAVLRRFWR